MGGSLRKVNCCEFWPHGKDGAAIAKKLRQEHMKLLLTASTIEGLLKFEFLELSIHVNKKILLIAMAKYLISLTCLNSFSQKSI